MTEVRLTQSWTAHGAQLNGRNLRTARIVYVKGSKLPVLWLRKSP